MNLPACHYSVGPAHSPARLPPVLRTPRGRTERVHGRGLQRAGHPSLPGEDTATPDA